MPSAFGLLPRFIKREPGVCFLYRKKVDESGNFAVDQNGLRRQSSRMRIVFMGTDNIALPSFQRLLNSEEVVGLVTQPDKPVGRHQVLMPPALKVMAEEYEVPVLQPKSLKDETSIEDIACLKPDLIAVMAYGQILPERLINLAPSGCINVHASLLPRHRGASCVPASILAGDLETGITIIDVVKRLDAGDMIKSSAFRLIGKETGGILHKALGDLAPNVLMDAIHLLENGQVVRTPQDESLSTYAPKLTRGDGLIDWNCSALEIERKIRAYDPWPGTFTIVRNRKGQTRKLKIFPFGDYHSKSRGIPGEIMSVSERGVLVCCGEGSLMIHTVQPEGSRKMPICDFVAGYALAEGSVFESVLEE